MLQRITVQIVEMMGKVLLVADQMLPEAMLPEGTTLFYGTPLGQMV